MSEGATACRGFKEPTPGRAHLQDAGIRKRPKVSYSVKQLLEVDPSQRLEPPDASAGARAKVGPKEAARSTTLHPVRSRPQASAAGLACGLIVHPHLPALQDRNQPELRG